MTVDGMKQDLAIDVDRQRDLAVRDGDATTDQRQHGKPAASVKIGDVFGATEVGGIPKDLSPVRLGQSPTLLVFFTEEMTSISVHYLESDGVNSYVQCCLGHEVRCLLCELKHQAQQQFLLPVFVVDRQQVGLLRISETNSPHSLGPQIQRELALGESANRFVSIARDGAKFTVDSWRAPATAYRGEREIAQFLTDVDAGKADVRSCTPAYTNVALWDFRTLSALAIARGIAREGT
jgi:hypothetical protein